MHHTEPATSQDGARQGTAQQPDADRRARRRAGLRGTSLGICVMLIAQVIWRHRSDHHAGYLPEEGWGRADPRRLSPSSVTVRAGYRTRITWARPRDSTEVCAPCRSRTCSLRPRIGARSWPACKTVAVYASGTR